MRELFREFAAARLRSEDEARRDAMLAWQVNRVHFQSKSKKRLMSPKTLMDEIGGATPDRPQSVNQLRSALQVLSGQYGIPLRQAGSHG